MKKWKVALIMLILSLLLAACGSAEDNGGDKSGASTSEQTKNGQDPNYPMTISPTTTTTENEEAGKVMYEDVTFESMPEKLVVFDYGFLDTLHTLGVEGVVGLPQDNNLPSHLSEYAEDEYTNVGTLKEPLLEDIAALQPDAIFISTRQATFYKQLKEITPNVVFVGVDRTDYWNTFLASVDIAAKLFDKEEKAKEYIAKIDKGVEEINQLAGNFETTLVTMYNEGKLSGFATNSRFGYMYDKYGFKPVTEDIQASSHGSNFGFEAILEFDPDVLFIIDRTAATGGKSNIKADIENEIIKKTTAYKNDRIIYLDGPLWYLSEGGLQAELAKIEEVLTELK